MLLHKGAEWVWGAAQEEAFSTLKQRLVAKPIPALFEPELETRLYTDASRIGLAGILAQVKDGKEFVVSYFSRHTTSAEQNYNSLELETLAIVASVKRFRQFLWGRSFTIYTDYAAVRSAFLKKDVNARVGRWVLELSEFQYQIRHKGNQQMRHADALSRNPPTHEYDDEWVQNLPNIQLGLNDTVNSAIRVTPSEALMGNSLFPGHVRGRRARGGGRDQGP
jgi:hypothetical protein